MLDEKTAEVLKALLVPQVPIQFTQGAYFLSIVGVCSACFVRFLRAIVMTGVPSGLEIQVCIFAGEGTAGGGSRRPATM